jgi:hypothetical protein
VKAGGLLQENKMTIGKRKTGGADFMPFLKYDARVGKFYAVNRVRGDDGRWGTVQTELLSGSRATVDLPGLQVGWIKFPPGLRPETRLVPAGRDHGERPDESFQEGFCVLVQIDGVTREFMSTAAATWIAIDELHNAWGDQAPQQSGKVPVVELGSAQPQRTGNGTNYRPVFKIVAWTARPGCRRSPRQRPISMIQFRIDEAGREPGDDSTPPRAASRRVRAYPSQWQGRSVAWLAE